MAAKKSSLELLIEFPREGSSEERRDLMRLCTNSFLAAPDRYGSRDTEYFDLLFSRILTAMDHRLRRSLAMAMAKSGVSKDHVKKMLTGDTSVVNQILRRSSIQPQNDLLATLRERTAAAYKAPMREASSQDDLTDGNRFMLPRLLLEEAYRFVYFSQRHYALRLKDKELLEVLDRTAKRFRAKIIEDSQIEIRDDIIHARKAVADKLRRNKLNEDYLCEVLQATGSSEFTFALSALLDVDLTTSQRILNDTSWETLAIACRASKVSRGFFATLIAGMQRRRTDHTDMDRIVALYNKIPEDGAERVMRFLQVRISSMESPADPAAPAPIEQPPVQETQAGFGKMASG